MEQQWKALLINRMDNVALALEDIPAGAVVKITGSQLTSVLVRQPVPFGHKIAITNIEKGHAILKYGVPIAFANEDIPLGEWVHEHNARSYFAEKLERKMK
jgi:altronate dehydratase